MGGMIFGIAITAVVAAISLILYPASHLNWVMLLVTVFLSALSCSALGAFVSVVVKEVFEAQTLANFFRFPMMFLGGVFVPVNNLPLWLQVIARCLPLTYSVEALRNAIEGASWRIIWMDLAMLLLFSAILYGLSVFVLSKRIEE